MGVLSMDWTASFESTLSELHLECFHTWGESEAERSCRMQGEVDSRSGLCFEWQGNSKIQARVPFQAKQRSIQRQCASHIWHFQEQLGAYPPATSESTMPREMPHAQQENVQICACKNVLRVPSTMDNGTQICNQGCSISIKIVWRCNLSSNRRRW